MSTVFDVPAKALIDEVAVEFRKKSDFQTPNWSLYVKTGCSRDRAPEKADWWQTRVASVLRKIYTNGPVGVQRLRTYYGGKQNRGVRPSVRKDSSGKIIRLSLQQLEKANFVKKDSTRGRVITPSGQKFLDNAAFKVKKELEKSNPALAKY
ncbi:MAG: 30S ribosomal protein S19e [Candidatus Diapherotrites archaeon]|nr:30S ribosomal protein S19e [Candidatus Diapherotrites archaeon]